MTKADPDVPALFVTLPNGQRIPKADFEKQRLTKEQLKAGFGPIPNREMRRQAQRQQAGSVRLTAAERREAKGERERKARIANRNHRLQTTTASTNQEAQP